MGAVADRVKGLERGDGDHLVKPFAFAELTARADAAVDWTTARTSSRRHYLGPIPAS
jgi:DNA-binding response OmpR family regulator